MTLSTRGIASVLALAVISDAFRVRPKRSRSKSTEDAAAGKASEATEDEAAGRASKSTEDAAAQKASGYVKTLYTWGAPSVLDDGPLRDPRTGGCWDGLRIITIGSGRASGTWDVDTVSHIANAVGYWHSHQQSAWLSNESRVFTYPCGEHRSEWGWTSVRLHSTEVYESRADLLSGDARTLTKYFIKASYQQAQAAATYIRPSGYSLVGSSEWDDKETHLYQHPSSKDCVLSWQGTTSDRILDWWDNIRFYDVSFCGAGENVHGGFVDQLRTILDTQSFKDNIQNKLPKCNELTVVGHSLGGALAAIYSYCLNKGSAGGSDYDRVKFTKSTPKTLPPLY